MRPRRITIASPTVRPTIALAEVATVVDVPAATGPAEIDRQAVAARLPTPCADSAPAHDA
ncbi:MAG: hypothetical protein K6T74_15905 [Geminicoccaceae bacterium]|nr:hypothetical protein [Geminicoccaceae bacterium]